MTESDPLPVTLSMAGKELQPVFERLWQLYRHDLGEHRGSVLDDEGLYKLHELPLFFTEPERNAYLIRHGTAPAGFALTIPWGDGRSVYAYFVARPARRHRVGHRAAFTLLRDLEPGLWEIAFQEENPGAARFWRQVATDVAGSDWREELRPVPPPAPAHLPDDVWILLDTTDRGGRP